jgi:hypothetical protein
MIREKELLKEPGKSVKIKREMNRVNSESWHWHATEYDQVLEEMESGKMNEYSQS